MRQNVANVIKIALRKFLRSSSILSFTFINPFDCHNDAVIVTVTTSISQMAVSGTESWLAQSRSRTGPELGSVLLGSESVVWAGGSALLGPL